LGLRLHMLIQHSADENKIYVYSREGRHSENGESVVGIGVRKERVARTR